MDAVKFIEERNRMCGTMSEVWGVDAAQIVKNTEEWAAEHPRKTRQSVFLEQWPNAKVDANGVLEICPVKLDMNQDCLVSQGGHLSCADCCDRFWRKAVER